MSDILQPAFCQTQCYVQPGCQLYNEDCIETMQRIETGSIDLMLTDPPYNTTQCDWEHDINLPIIWLEWERVIKNNGVLVIFADEPFTSNLILSKLDLFKYRITWDKMIGGGFLNAKKMPLKQTEDIVVFSKMKIGNFTYNPIITDKHKSKIRPVGNRKAQGKSVYGEHNGQLSDDYEIDKSYPSNLLSIASKQEECNPLNRWHPTQKPFELKRWLVKTYSNENDLVFDGYSGSGTTAAACIKEKRRFIGAELSKEYFDKSVERLELLRSQPELF